MSTGRSRRRPARGSRRNTRKRSRLARLFASEEAPRRRTASRSSPRSRPSGKRRRRRTKRGGVWRRLGRGLYWSTVAAIWAALIFGGLSAYYVSTLPDPQLTDLETRTPQVRVLAADGTVMAERGSNRARARLERLPPHLVNAVLAIEDRRFYSHFGVDPPGLARAAWRNVLAGAIVEGGSTITQQLAKNLFLTPERTFARKFEEMILALWLETKFSKNRILEIYLNRVYFGAGTYGVESAAQRYFAKPAREVTLAEAALLAGLLRAPSRYAPTDNPQLAEERAAVVLSAMVEADMLAPERAMTALAEPARVRNPGGVTGFEYAADWAADRLAEIVREQHGDLIVETTVDAGLQRAAQKTVAMAMASNSGFVNADQAAAVVLGTDGAVKALVGGTSYKTAPFNRAVEAHRQPGSAFKPVIYLAALEAGLTPESVIEDAPVAINGWRPKNYNNKYEGPVTLRRALARSLNSVAVRLTMEVGRWRVVRTARRLGFTSPLHENPSIALGTAEVTPLELTAAYAPFANGGAGVTPHIVKRVRTAGGEVLFERRDTGPGQVVAPPYVGAMNDMMAETLRSGTGKAAALPGRPAAGKTGTSQNFRDAWFVGYTAQHVAGVWVGNDDGAAMKRVAGGGLPARIWKQIMTRAHEGLPVATLPGGWRPSAGRPRARRGGGRAGAAAGAHRRFLPAPRARHAAPEWIARRREPYSSAP
jgi:penicillin-binding protein 1A